MARKTETHLFSPSVVPADAALEAPALRQSFVYGVAAQDALAAIFAEERPLDAPKRDRAYDSLTRRNA